ncbi:MAG: hypothetical protein ACP5NA_05455 [Candidatus Acidulodesulfobacterium sp.]
MKKNYNYKLKFNLKYINLSIYINYINYIYNNCINFYSILLFFLFLFPAYYINFTVKSSFAANYSPLKKYTLKKKLWVHKLRIKSGIIYKLNTAPGYVSVITLPVIPLDVALGNTGAFSEQIVGRQIFIKPITYDYQATSNLEIYTKYGLINVLLRIRNAEYVTYNLNIANTIKNVFAKNYVKNKLDGLKTALLKKYKTRESILSRKAKELKKEKKKVMDLILMINRKKINRSATKDGITLTVISVSRIKNFYYMQYQLTNNSNRKFFVRNVYLYREYGGNFFNGYTPDKLEEIQTINKTPRNKYYMPYKIIKNVIIFKKEGNRNNGSGGGEYSTGSSGCGNMRLSFHIIYRKRLIKLKINGINP